jgi:hypothetical protein
VGEAKEATMNQSTDFLAKHFARLTSFDDFFVSDKFFLIIQKSQRKLELNEQQMFC